MKLYLAPRACSLAVDIVARELQIPLSLEWVDVRAKRLRDGSDYYRINAKGQVPTLELPDGQRLTEGPIIMQYLADLRPGNSLLAPPASMERYRVLEWLNFIGTELHKGFTPLFRPATPDAYRLIARQHLQGRLQWLNDQLAGRDFLTGQCFTVADAYAGRSCTTSTPRRGRILRPMLRALRRGPACRRRSRRSAPRKRLLEPRLGLCWTRCESKNPCQ